MKKSNAFLWFLLGFCACNTNNDAILLNKEIKQIPQIYESLSSKNLAFKSDTAFVNNKLFSGFIYELDQFSKDTMNKSGYLNGLLSGLTQKWYKKNALKEERHYSKGAKNGKQTAYWENGKKKFEFIAKNDTYEGELKEWNVNGSLIHLATFKNGQEEGTQKMWYDNGKIRANYVMRNGKRYGLLGTKNCVNVSDSVFVIN
jgi:antitoxin component YwqK of YwqJK toxin-antitoxin module